MEWAIEHSNVILMKLFTFIKIVQLSEQDARTNKIWPIGSRPQEFQEVLSNLSNFAV